MTAKSLFMAVSGSLIFLTWPVMVGLALWSFFDSNNWFVVGLLLAAFIEGVLLNCFIPREKDSNEQP